MQRQAALEGRPCAPPGPQGRRPPAPSHPLWPLPSPPAPPGSKCHTQASGTGCSASSIPALFSFRGCPPKYPALWRQRQPCRPPGNTLESLGPGRGASGAAKATAGWREGIPGMSRWGRARQPRTHQHGFVGWAEAGAAAPWQRSWSRRPARGSRRGQGAPLDLHGRGLVPSPFLPPRPQPSLARLPPPEAQRSGWEAKSGLAYLRS